MVLLSSVTSVGSSHWHRGGEREKDTQTEAGVPFKRKEAAETRTESRSPFSVEVSVDGCDGSLGGLSASVFGLNCFLKRRKNSGGRRSR